MNIEVQLTNELTGSLRNLKVNIRGDTEALTNISYTICYGEVY